MCLVLQRRVTRLLFYKSRLFIVMFPLPTGPVNFQFSLRLLFHSFVIPLIFPRVTMLLSLAFLFLTSSLYFAPGRAQTLCNGHAELCGRKYSNITSVGAHDSAFVGQLPQDNQDVSVTAQLDAGIRFLQVQSHKNIFGILHLCHTSCFELDAGTVESYLATVNSWLDAHPNEVVTLLIVNGDNVPVAEFDDAYTSSGLKSLAYTPPKSPLEIDA